MFECSLGRRSVGRCLSTALFVLFFAAFSSASARGFAESSEAEGISVVGVGKASALPDSVEFHARILGASELGADAMAKYRAYRERIEAKLKSTLETGAGNPAKAAKLQVVMSGLSIGVTGDANQMYFPGLTADNGEGSNKPQVAVSGMARILVRGIQDWSEEDVSAMALKLYDELQDGGLTLLPSQSAQAYDDLAQEDPYPLPAVATFVLHDSTPLVEKAREEAFEAARKSAERLAKIAGVKLGEVLSIYEGRQASSSGARFVYVENDDGEYTASDDEIDSDDAKLQARSFKPIPAQVTLRVRFAIEK